MFPQAWRWVLWLNPMSAPVTGYQAILLQGQWPAWTVWAVTIAWTVALAGALAIVVSRSRDQLADWL
jgi:lipopolysaccharide transport system permease protein